MKLLSEQELIWSSVVANNSMNRKRVAFGVNSYEKELNLNPATYLDGCLEKHESCSWLDLCCGEGNALLQYATGKAAKNAQANIALKGIDLVDYFSPVSSNISCLTFETAPLVTYQIEGKFDLITCVHGLHYIGDRLKVLFKAIHALTPEGIFLANFDLNNIKVKGDSNHLTLKKLFTDNGILYDGRQKIIRCEGPRSLSACYNYIGADDTIGPNYTGQPTVAAYYSI
ncbi:class I SAM-dependent methyltransferase [Chitinophaga sp. Hz27]|uniref:class I SAM-dependent methyltransferase n=1 Tax=Chitinophaga sp. Hz27 TaxID=3347169 RepID=UPI0035E303B1